MIDLRLSQLRQFLLLVETKKYKSAAELSYRSQPALSHAIRELEQRLGAPLFEQNSRATLTPFGESCLPLIRESLLYMDRSIATMRQLASVSTGSIAFAVLPATARIWMPSLVGEFRTQYPDVDIRVRAATSPDIQRLVATGDMDFGITSGPTDDPKLVFEPLVHDRFGLVCRSDHHCADSASVRWDRLVNERMIGSDMNQMLEVSLTMSRLPRPTLHVSNLPTLVGLIKGQLGVALMPALDFPMDEPDLTFVPLVQPVAKRTIGIVRIKDRSLSPSASAMIQVLHSLLASSRWAPKAAPRIMKRMIAPIKKE